MNPRQVLVAGLLAAAFASHPAFAAVIDHNYYVVDSSVKQHFDTFNDGKNTYVEAVPGLVIRGATVDGDRYIVYGVPNAIYAQFHGRDITLTRGTPPKPAKGLDPNETDVTGDLIPGGKFRGANRSVKGVTVTSEKPDPSTPAAAMQWSIKPSHHSLQQLIEDWASRVGIEVFFRTRDFPLDIKTEKVISTGDFWAAITLLGEAYRDSDSPFQVQPTDFKQIVIKPMRNPKAAAGQNTFEEKN